MVILILDGTPNLLRDGYQLIVHAVFPGFMEGGDGVALALRDSPGHMRGPTSCQS